MEFKFLNFLTVKMKTLSHDDIVLLTVNHFGSEWIESSRSSKFCLRVVCGQVLSAYHLRLLNEFGENIPRFVSHHLDELPPVTFKP